MNKTKIDWADSTWNPVSGCLHGCEYCYARGMANRFKGFECRCGGEEIPDELKVHGKNSIWNTTYDEDIHAFNEQPKRRTKRGKWQKASYPYGFEPTFHKYRLDEYKTKKGRNIFVCSMADLFGDWVPDEWIKEVFKACEEAPQHRYLFLTKNPKRYIQLAAQGILPKNQNMWYGTTTPTPDADYFFAGWANTFISIEPLLEPYYSLGATNVKIEWVIIGAESGNRKNKVIPKREWIENIVKSCRAAGIPVFMKESIRELMGADFVQEFPWGGVN